MKWFNLLFLSFCTTIAAAQSQPDQSNATKPGYKQWTKYQPALRVAIGLQKAFFSEIGITRHRYIYNDLGFASKAQYAAFEWTPSFTANNNQTYGLKLGYELNARLLALAFEAKYQTDFKLNDVVLTPKIGLGAMGMVNLFYGYHISTANLPFSNIGRHQFTIVANLNKNFFKQQ